MRAMCFRTELILYLFLFFRTVELCLGDGEFLSSIRAARVLRPLRAINRVPSKYAVFQWPLLKFPKFLFESEVCGVKWWQFYNKVVSH